MLLPVQNQFWSDRTCRLIDPSGHVWTIATRIEKISAEGMTNRWSAMLKNKS